ncbi:ATP-binding cassette domain-containing protein [Kordiimonas laminariae]|uniref:ATP-binding cassette domain-containing protein n=1 Tax=Kordiimonas laminariae TaxID=2917717 RepID=UPI001FF615BF|nr:ATP-binding cassette domain-containing protein [Kordiimonas laminariae]
MVSIFEIQSVTKSFGEFTAIKDVSLDLPEGKVTSLIGPSGCGKSTLLKLMLGLEQADQGSVRFRDSEVCDLDLEKFRQKIGYVIQTGGLFPHYTARENIILMAQYLGWPANEIDMRLEELINLTSFPVGGLDKFSGELSGGQRQRVALMRALMLKPDVLFLDEPLGALDTIIRHDLQTDLKQIFSKLNMTVVLVTHDMAEAVYLADHLVLMSEGGIVQQGKLADMVHKPADPFVTRFLTAQRHINDMLEQAK